MGAPAFQRELRVRQRRAKAAQAPALDEANAKGYRKVPTKTSRRGVAFAPALSVQNVAELLSPAALALEPDG